MIDELRIMIVIMKRGQTAQESLLLTNKQCDTQHIFMKPEKVQQLKRSRSNSAIDYRHQCVWQARFPQLWR